MIDPEGYLVYHNKEACTRKPVPPRPAGRRGVTRDSDLDSTLSTERGGMYCTVRYQYQVQVPYQVRDAARVTFWDQQITLEAYQVCTGTHLGDKRSVVSNYVSSSN
jgi:hypothetical protein